MRLYEHWLIIPLSFFWYLMKFDTTKLTNDKNDFNMQIIGKTKIWQTVYDAIEQRTGDDYGFATVWSFSKMTIEMNFSNSYSIREFNWVSILKMFEMNEFVWEYISSHLVWEIQIEWICYKNHSYSTLSPKMDYHSFLRTIQALRLEIIFLHPHIWFSSFNFVILMRIEIN